MKGAPRDGALALVASLAAQARAQDKVRLAVGGKSAVFYLPLSVTERLGYFKDAGLDVEISDVAERRRSPAGARSAAAPRSASAPSTTPSRCRPRTSRSWRCCNTAAIRASCWR